VAISDTATAQITTHKNLGNTRIAYKPRQARARAHTHTHTHTHLNTRSQKKHRWQLVTQLLTNHNTQKPRGTVSSKMRSGLRYSYDRGKIAPFCSITYSWELYEREPPTLMCSWVNIQAVYDTRLGNIIILCPLSSFFRRNQAFTYCTGGLLWTRWWTLGFYKRRGLSWLAEWLLASQEGLFSISVS
jgi:hypothetical protein